MTFQSLTLRSPHPAQDRERLGKEGHSRDRPGTSARSERLAFGLGGIGRGQVEDPGRAVLQTGGHKLAVAAGRQRKHRRRQPGQNENVAAVGRVPEANSPIVARRDNPGPISRDNDRADGVGVTGERANQVAVIQVEDLDRPVGRARDDLISVGVGGHGVNRPLMAGEDPHGCRLPDPDRPIGCRQQRPRHCPARSTRP